ncbi:MAG: helix-turn-helix transcriptional regulator, partial [Thermomicrobiales bacterium]|nr:helix-turn-helix transcriptional regulator [Thermomicrobiales bacterium]
MPNASDQPVAGIPLLATKLHVPAWRPGSVSRPRLVAALERGAGRKLTLVSAGAGFGKSTLLAEWLTSDQAGNRPVAWVSLDSGDNDPALFWTYLVTALCQARPAAGEHALSLLRSPHPPPIESVLTVLINELAALEETIILVLDDLHTIESRPIHEALAFLIDRLPPSLRLVAATRADPPLPLSRYRGRGELAEVRTADLRFSPEEAAAFFNEMMGYELAVGDVAALEARTEGWIAGLQLAALSLRGQRDVAGFIRTFAGDHRYVVDYLIEEVLQRQPEDDRTFLLQTAILDRLNGPLCSAVTGQNDGGARLEALERGTFFVVPLDDTRTWYRYHHLFGDVLRARLLAEQPDLVAPLHRRASAWFERHGSTADAIRHALAGGDVERAADLVELAAPTTRRNRQEAT